jgi:hypothetical protein
MARTSFLALRNQVEERPGASQRLAAKRADTLEEKRLYDLRFAEVVSQAELAGPLPLVPGSLPSMTVCEAYLHVGGV